MLGSAFTKLVIPAPWLIVSLYQLSAAAASAKLSSPSHIMRWGFYKLLQLPNPPLSWWPFGPSRTCLTAPSLSPQGLTLS